MTSSLRLTAALVALLAVDLVLHGSLAEAAGDGVVVSTYILPAGGDGSLLPQECAPRCDHRCSKASRQKRCLVYCNMCCKKCLCVPSGTFGNKEECPCYNNWKNKKGGPKCP